MRTFKDATGREWQVHLSVAEVEDLIDELQIDIGKPDDLQKLVFGDIKTLLAGLAILIRDQLEARKITPREMKKAFDADTFIAARDAMWEEVLFFTPSSRRPTIERMVKALRTREATIRDRRIQRAEGLIAEIESGAMDAKILPEPSDSANSATGSPASSELTPAH